MFLTRSKTSSAINEEQHHIDTNTYPIIPHDMLITFENAVPNIDAALNQILPDNAKDLMLNMISSWIISSRIAVNSNGNKLQTQSNKTTLRSWATRSFSLKPKPIVTPMKLPEISDKNHQQPPSLTNSSRSTFSSEDEDNSLYTQLIDNSADGSTSAPDSKQQHPFSQLPVSLKSMIDLLDTPPLIPDTSTLSLIEESLTPLTSTFFEGQDHLAINPPSNAAGRNVTFKTVSEINQSHSAITMVASSSDTKSIGHSISTIFSQLGNSMRKAFKKKAQSSSISQLKKTFSVQHNLSLNKEQKLPFASPNDKVGFLLQLFKLYYCLHYFILLGSMSFIFITCFCIIRKRRERERERERKRHDRTTNFFIHRF